MDEKKPLILNTRLVYALVFMLLGSTLLGQSPDASEEQKVPKVVVGSKGIPQGQELVNMDFPELTDIKDIIKAIALWTGKNVILDRNVTGKVQIISPRKVTKEEAYQAFLSALNLIGLTTVETGKVIKIMKVRNAVKGNLKTYMGASWAPRTDEIITQIIPLKYIDAKQIQSTLARIVSSNSMIAYEPTNTLIISDSGYKVRRVLEILELLDVQTQQPKVLIVPIKYSDPKSIADKVNQIIKSGRSTKKSRSSYLSFKILTDDRSNSVIIFGPPRTIKDVRELVKKFDIPIEDPSAQAAIHVRPLDYADAKKLAATLSSLASGSSKKSLRRPPVKSSRSSSTSSTSSVADLGEGVKITADEASNSLLITGSRAAYDALNAIIRKLDVRRAQVYLEADVLDVNQDDSFKFGTSLFFGSGSDKAAGSKQVYGWEAGKIAPLITANASTTGGAANATSAAGVASAFSDDLTIGVLTGSPVNVPGLGSFSPAGLVSLIKSDSSTSILSSPHILTSNNEEAVISVGETVFYKTTTLTQVGSQEKAEKEKVDLTLTVKPNVSHSNYVTLKLDLEANRVLGISDDGLPNIANRKTKQLVTVKNGQTVVMSGLLNSNERENYRKFPLLGDIPILGWLFRNTEIQKRDSNLMVFITPYIVHGAADLAAIYEGKRRERDDFLAKAYGSGIKNSSLFKRLPNDKDGAYNPSPLDIKEEERLKKQKEDIYKAMGYGGGAIGPTKQTPGTSSSGESEIAVPVQLDHGGGGADLSTPTAIEGGGSDAGDDGASLNGGDAELDLDAELGGDEDLDLDLSSEEDNSETKE